MKIETKHTPKIDESTPRTRQMGRDGRLDIRIALDIIDENLYPGQTGWGLEMATAIDELHFHKAAIVKCVNAHAELLAALEEMFAAWRDAPLGKLFSPETMERRLAAMSGARAAIAKAKGQS